MACSMARRTSSWTMPRIPPPSSDRMRTPALVGLNFRTAGLAHLVASRCSGQHWSVTEDLLALP